MEGVLSLYGNYDQCLAIQSPPSSSSSPLIRGKYCLVKVYLPLLDPVFYHNRNHHKLSPSSTSKVYRNIISNGDQNLKQYPVLSLILKLINYQDSSQVQISKNFKHCDNDHDDNFNKNVEAINTKLKLLQAINMFNGTLHYRMGICIPSSCSPGELDRAINKCKFIYLLYLFLMIYFFFL